MKFCNLYSIALIVRLQQNSYNKGLFLVPLRPLWRREIRNANEPTISGTIESSRVGFSRRDDRSGAFITILVDIAIYTG
jgi:hypothetical protein